MFDVSDVSGSCGSQPAPTKDWSVDQLGGFAQAQHQIIDDGERYLTPAYWRLGQSLHFARKRVKDAWGEFLNTWCIDKTRASKARAIFETFKDPEQVSEMSVEQAYDKRKKRVVRPSNERTTKTRFEHPPTLREFFTEIRKWAGLLLMKAAATSGNKAQELLPEISEAIAELKRLEETIERRIIAD